MPERIEIRDEENWVAELADMERKRLALVAAIRDWTPGFLDDLAERMESDIRDWQAQFPNTHPDVKVIKKTERRGTLFVREVVDHQIRGADIKITPVDKILECRFQGIETAAIFLFLDEQNGVINVFSGTFRIGLARISASVLMPILFTDLLRKS